MRETNGPRMSKKKLFIDNARLPGAAFFISIRLIRLATKAYPEVSPTLLNAEELAPSLHNTIDAKKLHQTYLHELASLKRAR